MRKALPTLLHASGGVQHSSGRRPPQLTHAPARPPVLKLPALPCLRCAVQDGFGVDEKAGTCKSCPNKVGAVVVPY